MRQKKLQRGAASESQLPNIDIHAPLANTVCGNSKANVREAEETDYICVGCGAKLCCYSAGTTQKEFCRSANLIEYSLIVHENNTEFD